MAYVLTRGRTFTTDVTVKRPLDDNKISREVIRATFEIGQRSKFDEVMARERELKAEGEAANGRVMWLNMVLKDVSNLTDADNQKIEWTDEVKAEFLDDHLAVDACFNHYWECINNGKAKVGN